MMGERLLSSWFGGAGKRGFSPSFPRSPPALWWRHGFLLPPPVRKPQLSLCPKYHFISPRKGGGASGENSRPPNVYCDANYGQVTWIVAAVYRDFFFATTICVHNVGSDWDLSPRREKVQIPSKDHGEKEGCIQKGELFLALISHRLSRKKNTFGLPPPPRGSFPFSLPFSPPSLVPLAPKFSQASRPLPPPYLHQKKGKRGSYQKAPCMHARTHTSPPPLPAWQCLHHKGRKGGGRKGAAAAAGGYVSSCVYVHMGRSAGEEKGDSSSSSTGWSCQ